MANKKGNLNRELGNIQSSLSSHWNTPISHRRSASGVSTSSGGETPVGESGAISPALASASKSRKEERPLPRRHSSHKKGKSREALRSPRTSFSNIPTSAGPSPEEDLVVPDRSPSESPSPAPTSAPGISEARPSSQAMSQRNRNTRGVTRTDPSDEIRNNVWAEVQDSLRTLVGEFNNNSDNLREMIAQDNYMAKNKDTMDVDAEERKLDSLLRGGVKSSDSTAEVVRRAIENVKLLKELQQAADEQDATRGGLSSRLSASKAGMSRNPSRTGRDKDKDKEKDLDKDIYEFDGSGDTPKSPMPSSSHGRKLGVGPGNGGSDRSGNRDSVPPRGGDRDTPTKADSVEPQFPGGASALQRSKIMFVKGQDVIFKPKPNNPGEAVDWYLGKVQQVIGEGKSRRYKVKDEDPDVASEQRSEYRISARDMIPIPPVGQELPDMDTGKTVLALYPDSTTFYKAEVMGTDKETGKVNLRFDGEENSVTLQVVERRFVVEFRN